MDTRRVDGPVVAVAAAYAAQGFGYASVVVALPAAKDRFGLGDDAVSLALLAVCAAAALGSGLAQLVAVRRGSRQALCLGLVLQAAALLAVCALTAFPVFFGVLVPLAFSPAGEVVPERSDEVIARVNVFNYAGAVAGAVVPGLLGERPAATGIAA